MDISGMSQAWLYPGLEHHWQDTVLHSLYAFLQWAILGRGQGFGHYQPQTNPYQLTDSTGKEKSFLSGQVEKSQGGT